MSNIFIILIYRKNFTVVWLSLKGTKLQIARVVSVKVMNRLQLISIILIRANGKFSNGSRFIRVTYFLFYFLK